MGYCRKYGYEQAAFGCAVLVSFAGGRAIVYWLYDEEALFTEWYLLLWLLPYCRLLFVFGLALVALISSWGPVHARDWQPYLDVQEAEGLEVYIYYYSDQPEQSFEHAQLSFADAKQVSELLQQVKMNRPKFSFQQVRDELEAAGEPYIHFSVHTEKGWRKGGVGMCPPYYIFSDDTAYLAADEQVCQDLKALYDELLPKYIPADDGAQLAAE